MTSSSRPISLAPPTPLQVLVVSESDEIRATASAALESSGDVARIAGDLSGAISVADAPDVAFVDVTLPAGTALAVVHHLAATAPRCAVYAVAPVNELAQAAEAMSLGAKGLVVSPVSGDAILQSLAEVRAARALRERLATLEAARESLAEQRDLLMRAVRVARTGDVKQVAETLAGLVAVAANARGVAVFGPEDAARASQRLAAFGTALDLRERYAAGELADVATARSATLHPLTAEDRALGSVLVERVKTSAGGRLGDIIEFGTAMMILTGASRVEDPTHSRARGLPLSALERLLEREVETARSADRAFTLMCVLPEPGGSVEIGRLAGPLSEPGSACALGASGEAYVLLGRTPLAAARAHLRTLPYRAVGLAGFPADALTPTRLLRLAETRAKDAWRSPVIAHGLSALSLAEIAQALLETPSLESRAGSVYPLELAGAAATSLVTHACRQALRGALTAHVAGSGALEQVLKAALGERVSSHAIGHAVGCEALEVVVLLGDMGTWTLVGRAERDRVHAAHSADPLLAVIVAERLQRVAERGPSRQPPRKVEA